MTLVFDSSIIIEIERGNKDIIEKLKELRKIHPTSPKISFMSYFEFLYGLRKKSPKNKIKSEELLQLFETIQTNNFTASFLVKLKDKYELSLTDLFIASQVMENDYILVTKDRDFERIEEIDKVIF